MGIAEWFLIYAVIGAVVTTVCVRIQDAPVTPSPDKLLIFGAAWPLVLLIAASVVTLKIARKG